MLHNYITNLLYQDRYVDALNQKYILLTSDSDMDTVNTTPEKW